MGYNCGITLQDTPICEHILYLVSSTCLFSKPLGVFRTSRDICSLVLFVCTLNQMYAGLITWLPGPL